MRLDAYIVIIKFGFAEVLFVFCFFNLVKKKKKKQQCDVDVLLVDLVLAKDVSSANFLQTISMYIPCVWFGNLVGEQQTAGRINGQTFQVLMDCLIKYRGMLGGLVDLWYINIPLAYTQLVTLITYFHFATCLLSRQFLDVHSLKAQGFSASDIAQDNSNMWVPVFTIVEFFVFCGDLITIN